MKIIATTFNNFFAAMIISNRVFHSKFTVRYSETDRMGYLYYGHYAAYFEVARVEALRELGIVYKDLEDEGIILPVRTFNIHYKAPAHYDDLVEIQTRIAQFSGTRILFTFESYRGDALLNTAEVELVFVDKTTGRPCKAPQHIADLLEN
jgi:acyl-CoA thioester hydrolase